MHRRLLSASASRTVVLLSLGMAAYSGLAVWKEQSRYAPYADFPSSVEAAVFLVIGLLLAFRVNRAFDRWWEGRILWGTLVNACRNLAVKANNLVKERDASREEMQRLLVRFPYALKDHLRDRAPAVPLAEATDQNMKWEHVPSLIVNRLYGQFETWKKEQRIGIGEFWMLDREAKVLLEVCGSCERIKLTPIARSFGVFLRLTLAFFLLTLPWGIVNDFQLWTIPIVFLTTLFVMTAEAISHQIEQPFGSNTDALDLEGICKTIETSVTEILATDVRKLTAPEERV